MRFRLTNLLWLAVALANAASVPAPDVAPPSSFTEQRESPRTSSGAVIDRWWESFADPQLSKLIEEARLRNLDVRIASERVLETKAERRVARSALLPSINNVDSFSRIRGGFQNGNIHVNNTSGGGIFVQPFESNLFQLGLDASWEIDLFGGRRHELEAATADVQSRQEAVHDVLMSVAGEVARAYMQLRGTQLRLAIAKKNLAIQQDSLHLAQVRAEAGLGTDLDVERQREQAESTAALIPQFEAEVSASIHQLSVLLGEQPGTLAAQLSVANGLPAQPPTVPIGLPADLLTRRPDLRRARTDVIAAAARVGVAKADLFPKITLTGTAGRQTTDLSGFALGAGNFFSVGPGITIPILESGRIRANITMRKQQLAEAQTRYGATMLTALRETEDALSSFNREQERREKLSAAVAASQQAEQLAAELFARGLTDFLSVLDAEREQLANEDALAQSDTAVRTDLVSLYKSLGGGWSVQQP